MKELKKIDFSKGYFEADGAKWYITDGISVARYQVFEELSLQFAFNATFAEIFKQLRILWDNQNAMKFAENAVILHNLMMGIVEMEQKKHPVALRICALFINEENENIVEYSEVKMDEKIERWGKEVDVTPFFLLACNLVSGYLPAYEIVSKDILRNQAGRKASPESEKGCGKDGAGCCSK